MAHNLETLRCIHKRNGKLLETSLLKSCGKLSILSPKNWTSLYQKVATEKHRFAASKEVQLDPVDKATNQNEAVN